MAGRRVPRPLFRLAATAAALGATTVAAAAVVPAVAAADTGPAGTYLARLNTERANHGLPALRMRSDLTSVADGWAAHMAAAQTLAHNPSLATAVTNWQAVGENVGEGPSISTLDAAFMASPEHRANVLDPSYRDVGIGVVQRDGTMWITVDFRDPMYSVTSSPSVVRTSTTTTTTRHPTLRYGSRGAAVARVQRRLHIPADGIFGPQTQWHVKRFQHHHGLPRTGIVGHRTWHALGI